MADIVKINTVEAANIVSINGVDGENISKVNNQDLSVLTGPASVQCAKSPVSRLQIDAANVPAYNTDKCSLFLNFKFDSKAANQLLFNRATVSTGTFADVPFNVYWTTSNQLQIYGNNDAAEFYQKNISFNPTVGVWYNLLLNFDWANATAADRLKAWINRSAQSLTGSDLSGSGNTAVTEDLVIGGGGTGTGNEFNGVIHQFAFGSNVSWGVDDVTDTSGNQTIDLSGGLSGAILIWQGNFDDGIAHDYVQGADTWDVIGSAELIQDTP